MTRVHRDTVMRLGVRVGQACSDVLKQKMVELPCSRIEVDEIWGFIGKKQANVRSTDNRSEVGDFWTFLAIDPETKLMPCFVVGKRDKYHTQVFMDGLASCLKNRIQLSSDAMGA